MLNDFSLLTGIRIAFLDTEFNYISELQHRNDFCDILQNKPKGLRLCHAADTQLLKKCRESGKYEFHICHAGLYDCAMPIFVKENIVVGYVIMGRIRCEESPKECTASDDLATREMYRKLPLLCNEQLASLRSLLPNILFSSAISIENDSLFEEIREYIEHNINDKLSIDEICKKFFISKNHLYRCVKNGCGQTVGELIIKTRMNVAKHLMAHTDKSLTHIAETVGIGNYTYFCRLFKKRYGISPSEYRNSLH